MKLKKISQILVVGLLIFGLLAGCGGQPSTSPAETQANEGAEAAAGNEPAAQAGGDVVEIRFAWWGDTNRNEIYGAICDDFERENPDVRVIREPAPFPEYRDRITTQIAGGAAPDVMGVHASFASDYAERGVLADFAPWIANGTFETEYIPEDVLGAGRINGTLWMVAQGVTFDAMLINHSMIEELGIYDAIGVDYLNGEQFTWDSFAQTHRIFREATQAGHFSSLPPENLEAFRYWTRTVEQGSDIYSEDGALATSEETMVGWFSYYNDLLQAGLIPDAATMVESRGMPIEENLFANGKTAVMNVPANQYRLYAVQMPDADLRIINYPKSNDGFQINTIAASHLSVFANTTDEKKEAAFRFVNHFINRQSATNLLQLEQGVPINTISAQELEGILDENGRIILGFISETMLNRNAQGHALPPAGASEFQDAFRNTADRVAFGTQDPQAAVAQLISETDAIFARQ